MRLIAANMQGFFLRDRLRSLAGGMPDGREPCIAVSNGKGYSADVRHAFRQGLMPTMFPMQMGAMKERRIMADTATLSTRFQISIPKTLRIAHNWKAGQEFVLIPKGAGILLVPVPESADLAGIASGADAESYRDREDRF